MKRIWKEYDTSLISAIVAIIFVAISFTIDIQLTLAGLIVIVLLIALKIYYTVRQKRRLLKQISAVADELNFEQGKAFSKLTISCCVVDEDGKIIWLNDAFKQAFEIKKNSTENNIKQVLKKESLSKLLEGKGFKVKASSKYFAVYSSEISLDGENVYLLYFFDETKLRLIEKEYYDTRLSILQCVIDNSDEIYQNFKESDGASIFSKIDRLIDDWASSYGALCRKFSTSRTMIIVPEKGLQKMIADKFSILEKIRKLTYGGKSTEVTLSIGIGKEYNLIDANNSAKQAMDMAQSRGGDQVAIKHEAQYKFYGGVSEGFEKRNKVRTRLIAKTITEIIKDSDNVLIVGHKFSDFDSIGASVGMYCAAKHFGIKANIVVDKSTSLAGPLIDKLCVKYGEELILSPEIAPDMVSENTLIIVVDTHRQCITDCPALFNDKNKIMVIDHHRKSVDYIKNSVMFYHMPNSSSASEMVTELVQYVDTKPVIDSLAAQALFAGIMLDTRNFIIRTGVRTFEAAAYLKSRAASTVEVKKLFSNDMEIFRHKNAVIDAATKYRNQCAISAVNFNCNNMRLVTSQAADEMLNIDGVKASFVLYTNNDEIYISARSYGEINVQLIMESLGGGGHQAMSACQLKGTDMNKAIEKLKSAIDKYFQLMGESK